MLHARLRARSAAAVASRVFPMPPSPTMNTERPAPFAASSIVFERSASSALRPTSGASAPSRVSMGPMYERQFMGARLKGAQGPGKALPACAAGAMVASCEGMPAPDLRSLVHPLYDTEQDH